METTTLLREFALDQSLTFHGEDNANHRLMTPATRLPQGRPVAPARPQACAGFQRRSPLRAALAVSVLATALSAMSYSAQATTVLNDFLKLEGGEADFGTGLHLGGSPVAPGEVQWDYTSDPASGTLIASAHVTGTLYLDTQGSGTVELIVDYHGRTATDGIGALLASRVVKLSAGGAWFGALDPAHQKAVDVSFSSPNLHFVVLTTRVVRSDGALVGGTSGSSAAPDAHWEYKVSGLGNFTGHAVDFRGAYYQDHEYADKNNATVDFDRVNGTIIGTVEGTLYLVSPSGGATAQLNIDFLDFNGNVLNSKIARFVGAGGDPNASNNHIPVSVSFSSGRLWKIRLTVGTLIGTQFSPQDNIEISFVYDPYTSTTF